MLPTDYVLLHCIAELSTCSKNAKCNECKKEMKSLDEIDKFFNDLESKGPS